MGTAWHGAEGWRHICLRSRDLSYGARAALVGEEGARRSARRPPAAARSFTLRHGARCVRSDRPASVAATRQASASTKRRRTQISLRFRVGVAISHRHHEMSSWLSMSAMGRCRTAALVWCRIVNWDGGAVRCRCRGRGRCVRQRDRVGHAACDMPRGICRRADGSIPDALASATPELVNS